VIIKNNLRLKKLPNPTTKAYKVPKEKLCLVAEGT